MDISYTFFRYTFWLLDQYQKLIELIDDDYKNITLFKYRYSYLDGALCCGLLIPLLI
jgi:hypothetical protein